MDYREGGRLLAACAARAGASAFSRAFRRWSGAPPSVWRAAQAAGGSHAPTSRDVAIRLSPIAPARASRAPA
jgi:hypothetical protein